MASTDQSATPADKAGSVAEQVDASPRTALERRAAVEQEYGVYVATQPIDVGAARAFNVGDAVPVSHVKAYKYDELGVVAKRSTKAGQGAVDEANQPPGLG